MRHVKHKCEEHVILVPTNRESVQMGENAFLENEVQDDFPAYRLATIATVVVTTHVGVIRLFFHLCW